MELYLNGLPDDAVHMPKFSAGYWCLIAEYDDPGLCYILPQLISLVDTDGCLSGMPYLPSIHHATLTRYIVYTQCVQG